MNGERAKCYSEIHCKNVYSKEVFGMGMYLIWLVFVRLVGNQRYVLRNRSHRKKFE